MRTPIRISIVVIGLIMTTATAAMAHHSFAAEFDGKKPVKVRGKVTKMDWINPHVWIHLEVKKPDGTVEKWAVEAGTPNVLFRRGFTKESLKPGTEIIVDGYKAKAGGNRANGRDLTFTDGRKLFLGSSGTGAPYEVDAYNADHPKNKNK
jgi:hypothetical protein